MILPGTPVVPAAIGYLYRQYQRGGQPRPAAMVMATTFAEVSGE